MIEMGLSDSQIAGALHIKKSVIAELRANSGNAGNSIAGELREGKKNVQSKKTVKPEKGAGETGRAGDPDNINPENGPGGDPGGAPDISKQSDPGPGDQGPAGDPGATGIKFVGGKKHMAKKKENDPDPDEFEYECPHCHFEFNEKSDTCPSCGGSLSGYDD